MAFKSLVKPLVISAAVVTVSAGLGVYVWREEHRPPILEVYIFSLPSGRSIFIRTPEDKRILIDAGPNADVIRSLTDILPFYSRRIDTVIVTNTENRNVTGLIDVLERYKVSRAYVPGVTLESAGLASSTDEIYKTFLNTLEKKSIETTSLMAGETIDLDSQTTLQAIFPLPVKDFAYSKASAPELNFRISFEETSLVFIGGASNKVQKTIASSSEASLVRKTDTLIISGSALASNISPLLIDKLKPDYLVYSKQLQAARLQNLSANTKPTSKKKEIPDPLEYISNENTFNLKEGTVKIVSDGSYMIPAFLRVR
jgi:beta-lactamase superfamily II metal-dependent hydrolase